MSPRILALSASDIRRGDGRPRLPCTRAAGPSCSRRVLSRWMFRTLMQRRRAASATPSSSAVSLERTQARRCSLLDIVIVSFIDEG